jgi:hypothetical protein
MPERSKIEQKEIQRKPDFRQLFFQRLNAYPATSEKVSKIQKRYLPAVVFGISEEENTQYDVWIITDPKLIEKFYLHKVITQELEENLQARNRNLGHRIPSVVEQNHKGQLFISLDKNVILEDETAGDMGKFVDVANRYNFSGIRTANYYLAKEPNGIEIIKQPKDASVGDIVGERRENAYLFQYAQKYGMTINQFMRFRIRAISSRKAYEAESTRPQEERGFKYLIDLDTLATEVLEQEKEEGHL